MPRPRKGETKEEFISRYMGSKEAIETYPDEKQRYIVALNVWEDRNKNKNMSVWDRIEANLEGK